MAIHATVLAWPTKEAWANKWWFPCPFLKVPYTAINAVFVRITMGFVEHKIASLTPENETLAMLQTHILKHCKPVF